MNSDIKFVYEDGHAMCTINYKGLTFMGTATCHEDDRDFMSERVGLSIAECRANIKLLSFIREHEIKPQLKILNHLYSNMRNSKRYNPISYEASMLRSQIRAIENELTTINNAVADERKYLKDYIDGKDKLFQRLRAKNQ